MNRIYQIIAIFLAASLMMGCTDELILDDGTIPAGSSSCVVTVGFPAFNSALDSRSSGDAIKSIKSLWVVLFTPEGEYVDKYQVNGYDIIENTRPDGSGSSESMTGTASFRLTLPNGRWRMFAVANYPLDPNFTGNMAALQKLQCTWDLTDTGNNAQMFGYFTNTDKNDKSSMPESDVNDDQEGGINSFTGPIVTVGLGEPLHAWVRRAASKLTVAFNTANLKDNVYIYIKSMKIRDIPEQCYLGYKNSPGSDSNRKIEKISDKLIDGEVIYFPGAEPGQEWEDGKNHYTKWLSLKNGTPVMGMHTILHPEDRPYYAEKELSKELIDSLLAREHSESVPALYFYENNQGKGVLNTITDKRQDITGNNAQISFADGSDPGSKAWKDGKPHGTWVEIEGFYMCNDSLRPGRGPIKYRFMLGKDHLIDYNAERNHHYKLTLTFNGYANDVDFHIDYKEQAKPGFLVPPITYVGYLYNQEAAHTLRATPLPGYRLDSIVGIITDNEWRPSTLNPDTGLNDSEESLVYNKKAWEGQMKGTEYYVGGQGWANKLGLGTECKPNCEFGWLSLRKVTTVTYDMEGFGSDKALMVENFRETYYTPTKDDSGGPKGKRCYDFTGVNADTPPEGVQLGDNLNGKYSVHLKTRTIQDGGGKTSEERDYILSAPLYTRAKTLDPWAVYSGANPYNRHYRYARVRYTAYYTSDTDKNDKYTETDVSDIYQSRRLENPRAVYRKADSNEPFHVTMMYSLFQVHDEPLEGDVPAYEPVQSNGPWTATIEKDPNGIVSLKLGTQLAVGEGATISGRTGSFVDFSIIPRGQTPLDEADGAIITVRYHNNTCVHKIIFRRGYAPAQLRENGTEGLVWSSFNLYTKDKLCASPLSVGSMFVRCEDLSDPISERNNPIFPVNTIPSASDSFIIEGSSTKKTWAQIVAKSMSKGDADAFGEFELEVPGLKSVNRALFQAPDIHDVVTDILDNNDINFAFGIAYADGATKTLSTANAYAFHDLNDDNNAEDKTVNERGVRAVVAYSLTYGDNVLFPLGARGHARRKNVRWVYSSTMRGMARATGNGVLKYGSMDIKLGGYDLTGYGKTEMNVNDYRPMAYDNTSQFGAIYMCTGITDYKGQKSLAIDYNYSNYMTGALDDNSLYATDDGLYSDAAPIRPVRIRVIESGEQ